LPDLATFGVSADTIAKIGQWVAYLQTLAAQVSQSTSTTSTQSTVQTIVNVINTIVGILATVPLPAPIQQILQAATVLLPIIERLAGLTPPAALSRATMDPDTALVIIHGKARQ
jgi:hypothetical protein